MTKMYIVVADHGYEGFTEPEAAFDTLAGAEAEAARINKQLGSGRVVFELELNAQCPKWPD